MAGLWDTLAGAGLCAALLAILLFGNWRIRRAAFVVFCVFALSTFIWRAGCWYHQFSCDMPFATTGPFVAQG